VRGQSLGALIAEATRRLAQAGVDGAGPDARLLVAHALDCDRATLAIRGGEVVSKAARERIEGLIARRARREPVSRILGRREFWSLEFQLSPATLDPRPDSETLVEAVLDRLDRARPWRLLDLGTGTGALLLALLSELPAASGLGVDLAPEAVTTAAANAARLGLADRAAFRVGDWGAGIEERFDVVLSNPPYIALADLATLEPEVADHDPRLALDGGEDGLDAYRRIIADLPRLVGSKTLVAFEVGLGLASAVAALLAGAGFAVLEIRRDLGGIERCILASPGENFRPNTARAGN